MIQKFQFWAYIWIKRKTLTRKDIYNQMFIAALYTAVKIWKESKYPSTNEWIKKTQHTMEYDSAIKKNDILPFATMGLDLESIYAKWNHSKKDKYSMLTLICGV